MLVMSRPARGGWIEILVSYTADVTLESPAPHGAGGLKFYCRTRPQACESSRPARGGWIEIEVNKTSFRRNYGPAPHGAGGLKFCLGLLFA